MKCSPAMILFPLLALAGTASAANGPKQAQIKKVIDLLDAMRQEIQKEIKQEQQFYDKYACWCETTTNRKVGSISKARDDIEKLGNRILRNKGATGTLTAEVADLKKQVAANKDAIADAEAQRSKQKAAYKAETTANEQAAGSLEMAIKTLTGAGTGKSFLSTLQRAEMVGVAADLKQVFRTDRYTKFVSEDDLEVVRNFISNPTGKSQEGIIAAQTGQNPFGDYAPASSQIQGILKGMYDAFATDMEKDNADEADKQKSFQELMTTKNKELTELESTLVNTESDLAARTEQLADDQAQREATQRAMEADESFFEDMKAECQQKALDWGERTRLQNEELNGIQLAVKILSEGAGPMIAFVQVNSFKFLSDSKIKAANLIKLKAVSKSGGGFDAIIKVIDKMIKNLHAEAQADVDRKDECELNAQQNQEQKGDLEHKLEQLGTQKETLIAEKEAKEQEVVDLKQALAENAFSRKEATEEREGEKVEFRTEMKDIAETKDIVSRATAALKAFYTKNKIPLALVQIPEYTVNSDQAPEAPSADYGGKKSQTGGIISIMDGIVEDLTKDEATARKEEAESEQEYDNAMKALDEQMDAQRSRLLQSQTSVASLTTQIAETREEIGLTNNEIMANGRAANNIAKSCNQFLADFDTRRAAREDEIQGLQEAKGEVQHIPR